MVKTFDNWWDTNMYCLLQLVLVSYIVTAIQYNQIRFYKWWTLMIHCLNDSQIDKLQEVCLKLLELPLFN